ncbi:MAG: phytanoyl-CoA dioxygenase family protein [Polyangiaceae bacterium]|nr:phytanoyl-CoA dioxygenase family protein [Polyangiaceae bacterium]
MDHEVDIDLNLEPILHQYRTLGYARVGRILNESDLAALRDRANQIMLGKISYPGLFFQADTETGRYEDLTYKKGYVGPGLNYRKIEKLEKDPLYCALINHPVFERIARAWIAGDIVIYRSVLFNKPAHGGTVLPWHQDGGSYWGLNQNPTLQIWTAIDDADVESGCLEVIPGSHINGLATPLGGVIPDHVLKTRNIEAEKVLVPAKAGDVILVHNHLWHGSGLNHTNKPRRGLTTCYMSADTRCQRTKRAPRTFFPVFR